MVHKQNLPLVVNDHLHCLEVYEALGAKTSDGRLGRCVAVVDGQSRASDDALEHPPDVRNEHKMYKYARAAEENGLHFAPAVHTAKSQFLRFRGSANLCSIYQ